ncbi:MAG: T9SS type A sorting domain-containing protein [Bacteroidetes bacterium]|nr:T9SS type A sorting domain-containing protein [Bacteroidota bacterium]
MKKKIVLFTTAAGLIYMSLSSYRSGPGLNGENRTGARNSTTNCGGGGCHGGASANTTVAIIVDSTGNVPVTSYVPGMTYTILINGGNTSSLPNFGFQFTAVKGTGASQTDAGTFGAVLPTGVRQTTAAQSGTLTFIENKQSIVAAAAGYYTASFTWTAPAAGTGNVTMYCTLNAVDGNGNENSADKSANTSVVLTEQTATSAANTEKIIALRAYPNPVTDNLNISVKNAKQGTYHLAVVDINGRNIEDKDININTADYALSLNANSWARGTYLLHVTNGTDMKVIPIVKQ